MPVASSETTGLENLRIGDQAEAAGSKPSHPLMALTFRWSGACLGWPQSSKKVSGACLLL
jgi:hypothetical protein